jgi:hypothetical protein
MKKLLIVLLALMIVGVFAVAQDAPAASISVGAWGRGWINVSQTVLLPDGTASDAGVTAGPSWGGYGNRVGVSFNGSSENFGFFWNPGVDGTTMNPVCDQAKIWAKINPMIMVEIGKIQGDVLRGKLDDYGDILGMNGKDNIFARFYPNQGILLDITPMDGVYIGAALDAGSAGVLAEDAYKAIQVGFGYVIPEIGHLRAQYLGEGGAKAKADSAGMQVAFAYTGTESLLVDAGFTYWMESMYQMTAVVAASYSKDAFSTYDRIDANFGGDDGVLNAQVALQVGYVIQGPFALGAEVLFKGMSAVDADLDAKTVDIYPFVKLGYSNGYLKVGFDATVGLDDQDMVYAVPVQLEYWF